METVPSVWGAVHYAVGVCFPEAGLDYQQSGAKSSAVEAETIYHLIVRGW